MRTLSNFGSTRHVLIVDALRYTLLLKQKAFTSTCRALRRIETAFDFFLQAYGPKYEKATACLAKGRDALLSFCPHGGMDRRVRAVALHKHLGGAVAAEIGEHEPLERPSNG